jgi:ATP-dependent DNA ligase
LGDVDPDRLYPPRARTALHPRELRSLAGYVAQFKYNDIRTLVHLLPGGEVVLRTRQLEPHREYALTPRMRGWLQALELDPDTHHVLDGGVLRKFSVRGEQPLVLWDILVHEGRHLVGQRYRDRYALLKAACGNPRQLETDTGLEAGLRVRGVLWLAPWHTRGFAELFSRALGADFLEGLMLKDPGARLEPGTKEENNTRWQLKVRKPTLTYPF